MDSKGKNTFAMTNEPTPRTGAPMTPAFVQYQRAFFALMNFFRVDILLAESLPLIVDTLREQNPDAFRQLALISTASPEVRNPEIMQRIILELVMCRLVDHFKIYLCDVIENALTISPELLNITDRERQRVSTRYQTASEAELRAAAIVDAVDRLSDRPLADFLAFFRETLGVQLEPEQQDIDDVTECLAVRNILVHTRGRVNERFLRRTGRNDLRIGDMIEFSAIDCQRWSTAMGNVASLVDRRTLDTFGREVFLERFSDFFVQFIAQQAGN